MEGRNFCINHYIIYIAKFQPMERLIMRFYLKDIKGLLPQDTIVFSLKLAIRLAYKAYSLHSYPEIRTSRLLLKVVYQIS